LSTWSACSALARLPAKAACQAPVDGRHVQPELPRQQGYGALQARKFLVVSAAFGIEERLAFPKSPGPGKQREARGIGGRPSLGHAMAAELPVELEGAGPLRLAGRQRHEITRPDGVRSVAARWISIK
jgi:hypothetical protein